MAAFIWNNSFVTGLDDVDEQHFYLVGLINKFAEQLVQNQMSEEKIEDVFQELYDYTVYHFQEEERLMKKAGIAAQFLSVHIKVHQDFLQKIKEMHKQVSIKDPATLTHLLDFLIHWLAYHILGMDQNTARQLAAIKAGASAEDAFQVASLEIDNATETLLNALSNLYQQVSERNTELYQLNQTLESKVVQRTEELQEANLHLQELAVTDVLTNLPNRRYAMAHLSALWKKASQKNSPLSCLMVDADHFKEVNDQYGHDAGDKVLVELSQKLQQTLRNDDIVCRLGGDEFLVLCENTGCSGAKHIAQLLCDEISKFKVQVKNGAWMGSISIGVASKQADMLEMEDLIKMADKGVYLAKEAGKGCVKSVC